MNGQQTRAFGLKWILTVVFGALAVGVTVLFYLVINLSVNRQFGTYLETRMQVGISEAVSQISETWDEEEGWNLPLLTDVLRRAAANGISIVVKDTDGHVVLAGPLPNRGHGSSRRDFGRMFSPAGQTGSADDAPPKPASTLKTEGPSDTDDILQTLVLKDDGREIGTAVVSAPGSLVSTQDEDFLRAVNRVIVFTGVLLLLLGLGGAYGAAASIGTVFGHMTAAAERIGAGRYGQTMVEGTRIAEIQSLMDSINRLSLALEKQESLRRRLFSDVAHDLRTPVTILLSHLEAIRDGIWEADAERMSVCMEEANQLARLIAEVEKLARLDVGDTVLQPVQGDLLPAVLHAVAAWSPVYAGKKVGLEQAGGSAVCFFEPESLVTILNNLLGNALRHTPENGGVRVETATMGEKARLTVSDTGVGIPAADLPNIFERFYRADNSRTSETGGSGIGLAIVRALLEAQGGSVRVESELGRGSSFIVEFPMAPHQ